ncbi:B9 protein domain 1 [Angomonas deanei]|uniref:B9 domain-containing protein 1 n=1 Tax=Angomonas deanei TaxID=59799 RepID=S9WR83_9TRYP|nr:B9 protein domain 1 [Angomonas deanei]EPY42091.1 B9 protein domain 1 [Angomonas deanei]CAD2216424.1 Ciliary basal body-associated, B9 protein, putative [Angomonas deanei]|eukprot:EPY38460.1 B9 protein domain 1 [Angomonas deanei]
MTHNLAEDGKESKNGFQLLVHGVVEGAECTEVGTLFARTHLFFGPDWSFLTAGQSDYSDTDVLVSPTYSNNAEIVTQLSDRAQSPFATFNWSAPFEFALQSTNPSGWPQLVVTLHTVTNGNENRDPEDKTGNLLGSGESIIGYGRCFVPCTPGHHTKKIRMMQLENATRKHQFVSMLTREKPVLRDLSYLCKGEDRIVLTARSLAGSVTLSFSVMVNGLQNCGFEL